MTMKKDQQQYLLARIDQIEAQKAKIIRDFYTTKAPPITAQQIVLAISSGKFKPKKDAVLLAGDPCYNRDTTYGEKHVALSHLFDFGDFFKVDDKHAAVRDEALVKLRAETQRIKDSVILGDASEALAALKDFANWVPEFA